MSEFFNPFHFVPAAGTPLRGQVTIQQFRNVQQKKFEDATRHLTHDRYVAGDPTVQGAAFFSGRIICSLQAVYPFVVGDKQKKPDGEAGYGVVQPFELTADQPAIPRSSLRGLISSLVEALSDSTMRVLMNDTHSVRSNVRERKHHRNAIGRVVEEANGIRKIRPLTFPSMDVRGTQTPASGEESVDIPEVFQRFSSVLVLPVYLDSYRPNLYGFLQTLHNDAASGTLPWPEVRSRFWEMPYHGFTVTSDQIRALPTFLRIKERRDRSTNAITARFCLGAREKSHPATPAVLPAGSTGTDATRGILRVLGMHTAYRAQHLPRPRKHELFIPVPDLQYYQTGRKNGMGSCFDLEAEDAIQQFESMARERTAEELELPFELAGQPRDGGAVDRGENRGVGQAIRLHADDLVYFRLNQDGEIDAVAIAAIWREDAGRTHDYFAQFAPELIPFDANSQRRTIVTPAEQIFGFIPEEESLDRRPSVSPDSNRVRGLAGRVKFSDGIYSPEMSADEVKTRGLYLDETPLKILSSPKPPCPVFYFCRTDRNPPSKDDLAEPTYDRGRIRPLGRKFYLHISQTAASTTPPPWQTQNDAPELRKQKMKVTPVRPGVTFLFHIDFENLTRDELALLCRALKPFDDFHHKLGLGKPLGLGTVKIDPLAICYIDRQRRYGTDEWDAPRYHARQLAAPDAALVLASAYSLEVDSRIPVGGLGFSDLRYASRADIETALRLLGRIPEENSPPVHYPLSEQARSIAEQETNHYEWFVANDQEPPQYRQRLGLIAAGDQQLPHLRRLRRRENR